MAQSRSSSAPDAPDPLGVGAAPDILDGLRPIGVETFGERIDRWRRTASSPGLRSVAVIGAVVLLAGVGWWLLRPPAPPIESALPLASTTAVGPGGAVSASAGGSVPGGDGAATGTGGAVTTSTVVADLVVQASGAVVHPGVYRLAAGARVDDLVRAAGGLAPDADGDRVNLASPVADGERVWVPRRGELAPPPVVAGSGGSGGGQRSGGAIEGSGGGPGAGDPPEIVHLNTATAEELDTLPGVGPATATAILAHRDEHGPFSSVDDLLEVRGIGDAKLEQLRPLVDL